MRCYNCLNSTWIRVDKDWECQRMSLCEQEDKERQAYIETLHIKPGSKIKLDDNKWWLVQARDKRYIICTNDEYYTILDIVDGIRGADDHYGYYDYEDITAMELEIALAQLHIEEPTSIHDLDVKPQTKDWYIEKYCLAAEDEQLVENMGMESMFEDWDILPPLKISYRNWVPLKILEVQC